MNNAQYRKRLEDLRHHGDVLAHRLLHTNVDRVIRRVLAEHRCSGNVQSRECLSKTLGSTGRG